MHQLELLAPDNAPERHPEDLDVKPPGAVLEVVEVVAETAQHLLDGVRVAVVVGGVRSHAGTYLIQIAVARVALEDLFDKILALRARAHEGHLATEDVEQLRQLIEVVGADEAADLGQARVVIAGVERRPGGLGVRAHRAEFVDLERAAEAADALLLVEDGAAVLALDRDRNDEEQRAEHDQAARADEDAEQALHTSLKGCHAVRDVVALLLADPLAAVARSFCDFLGSGSGRDHGLHDFMRGCGNRRHGPLGRRILDQAVELGDCRRHDHVDAEPDAVLHEARPLLLEVGSARKQDAVHAKLALERKHVLDGLERICQHRLELQARDLAVRADESAHVVVARGLEARHHGHGLVRSAVDKDKVAVDLGLRTVLDHVVDADDDHTHKHKLEDGQSKVNEENHDLHLHRAEAQQACQQQHSKQDSLDRRGAHQASDRAVRGVQQRDAIGSRRKESRDAANTAPQSPDIHVVFQAPERVAEPTDHKDGGKRRYCA